MQQRVNVVTLVVTHLTVSHEFYVGGLGWSPAVDVPGEVLMFHVGDRLVLSLWSRDHAEDEIGPITRGGTPPFTLAHNCASAAEVDAVLTDARAAGAQVSAARQRDWGGYSGYFCDPDGFRWEVAHNPHPIGDVLLP